MAADLTSETLVSAITSFATFDPNRGTARAWLFEIARHVHVRPCARSAADQQAAPHLAGRREVDADEVEELVRRIDAERAGRGLMQRLRALPAADRLALELVDVVGRPADPVVPGAGQAVTAR